MESTLDYLEKLTTESKKSETEILALAFQTGLRQLWREHVLGRYLKQEISRAEAIELTGIDWVELAERQHQAMLEDTVWGLAD
jgi:hypothetical protein